LIPIGVRLEHWSVLSSQGFIFNFFGVNFNELVYQNFALNLNESPQIDGEIGHL